MTVTMNDPTFGVEIETIGRTRGKVAMAIHSVTGGCVIHVGGQYDAYTVTTDSGAKWSVVSDSSLTSVPSNLRAEVVTPILRYSDMDTLQKVVRAIRHTGARVDAKCGMHIHIGAAIFDAKALSCLVKTCYKQEELITHALAVSDSRKALYTRDIEKSFMDKIESKKPATIEAMNEMWYGCQNNHPHHYDSSRYHGLNLHNVWFRGTIEFRWFESTLHAGKVKASVQFCLALAVKALNAKMTSSKRRAFNADTAKYDFRVFLLKLGMIGDEFKTAREILLANMPGDAAYKNGRNTNEEDI